jgi:hypothetical protein
MIGSTATGSSALIVGLGGTLRANSSTERALRYCLESVERQGGRTKLFCGQDLDLPMYAPHELERTPKALELVNALRAWPTPLGVAINSADEIWDDAGRLADVSVQSQLDLLASQLLAFARVAWGSA